MPGADDSLPHVREADEQRLLGVERRVSPVKGVDALQELLA